MRRLRLKMNNLIKKDDNICKDFQSKNSTFNNKILDFYSGDYYLNHSIKYQSNFHFDKSENGEAHDKTKMISRIYSMKNKKISKKILEEELKDNEKELILEDPVYFFPKNNSKGDNNNNQKLTLAEKINQEEGHVFKKNYKDFIKFHMSKSHSKDKINKAYRKEFNDIDITIKKIKNNINKTIYKRRTKEFIFKENKMEKKRNKIINNMVESLRINKKINVIDNYNKRQQLSEKPTKIKKKYLIKKDDDDIDNFNKELSINYFNKEELNMIKRYNEKIKNGFFSTNK